MRTALKYESVLVGLAAAGIFSAMNASAGEIKIPKVPEGHPRVYVRPEWLPAIRRKLKRKEFAATWKQVQEWAGRRKSTRNEVRSRGHTFSRAFVYLVTGKKDRGRLAVDEMLAMLAKENDQRTFRRSMHIGACVYDWCYDLLSDEEKQAFIREFKRIASRHGPGYPARARGTNASVGHETEGWLLTGQLPAGVAIYDESPEMYEAAARLFLEKFVEVRNYWYPAHIHHQGDSYGARLIYDLAASWLFQAIGAGDVLTREQQFVPYHAIYCLRPDGQQIKRGDSFKDGRSGRKRGIMILAGSYYQDPFLLAMADGKHFMNMLKRYNEIFELLLRPAGVKTRPMSELPQTQYFPMPMGEMLARTGWTMGQGSRDALVYMRIGGTFFGNHQKRDMGTFQVYYRGGLAITTGMYNKYFSDHWRCYYHQTLASNGLLIFDPDEKVGRVRSINDGGQFIPNGERDHPGDLATIRNKGYEQGRVTARAFGPDAMTPDYSYIAGDITGAYTKKVERVTRSMAVLRLADNPSPILFVVFDRVRSAKAKFKKTWLLHSVQEPQVDGARFTVVRDEGQYRGKLDVHSLLPENPRLRKIGGPGKEFWVESAGRNYPERPQGPYVEPGAWRVEVSPGRAQKQDYFLHAMTVMDAGVKQGPTVTRFGNDDVVGVMAAGRAVVFSYADEARTSVSFTLETGEPVGVLVCDLAPGYWRVRRGDKQIHARLAVPDSARCLYFESAGGRHELERIDKKTPPEPKDKFWDSLRKASLKARG